MPVSHLRCRNGIYYVRVRVPQDLKHLIPRHELNQSLKTSDKTIAKLLAKDYLFQMNRRFVLLRSGFLDDDQKQEMVLKIAKTKDSPVPEAQATSFNLTMLIDDYIKVNQQKWRAKSRMEVEYSIKLAKEVMGNIGVDKLTRDRLKEYKDILLKLPANFNRSPKYKGMTIAKIVAIDGVKPMSVTSVNKHLSWLGSMLTYAVKEGYIASNPAAGLQVQRNTRADLERMAYSVEDMKAMVTCLIWNQKHPERYWVPLIGMYQGMRLNEICQLYCDDIQLIDGLWCFNVNSEAADKELKNTASQRIIPIHPKLLQVGLLKYVEEASGRHERLWPSLPKRRDGYAHDFGKWFQRLNRTMITDDPRKVFHSLRHSFIDYFKQRGTAEALIAEMVGHSNDKSMTMGRYGKRYQPKVLLEALQHLDYGIEVKRFDL
jgi:integrase